MKVFLMWAISAFPAYDILPRWDMHVLKSSSYQMGQTKSSTLKNIENTSFILLSLPISAT